MVLLKGSISVQDLKLIDINDKSNCKCVMHCIMCLQNSSQLSGFSSANNDQEMPCSEVTELSLDDVLCFEEEQNGCADTDETNVLIIIKLKILNIVFLLNQ